MTKIYQMDIMLCATAYVRAGSAEDAKRLILQEFGRGCFGELPIGEGNDVTISGRRFEDPRLPDVSLSPAVTFYGPADEGADPEEVEVDDD